MRLIKTQKIECLKVRQFCDLNEYWRCFSEWPTYTGCLESSVNNSNINYLVLALFVFVVRFSFWESIFSKLYLDCNVNYMLACVEICHTLSSNIAPPFNILSLCLFIFLVYFHVFICQNLNFYVFLGEQINLPLCYCFL